MNEILVKITDGARRVITEPQAETLAWKIIGHSHSAAEVTVTAGGFGLPETHLYTIWRYPERQDGGRAADFHMGIDPDGRCSS